MLTFTAACFHVDIYESASLSPASMKLFIQLQEHVSRETDYMKHFIQIEGMLHILLASVNTHNDTTASSTSFHLGHVITAIDFELHKPLPHLHIQIIRTSSAE